ncbi:hypothetical protein Bhyg_06535, partial [Pseudolycoriella hygida]
LTVGAQEEVPLKHLYQLVPLYPKVSFCNRTLVTHFWLDKRAGNVRHITYTGKLKPRETYRELCYCIDKHMSQKDWLEGARILCKRRRNSVTYEVIGRPDPTFDPHAQDSNFDRPMEKLRLIFSNTPTTDPVGLKCNASCTEESNIIHCSLKCPLKNESRTLDAVCADVVNYYDQMKWLKGASTKCENVDGTVVLNSLDVSRPFDMILQLLLLAVLTVRAQEEVPLKHLYQIVQLYPKVSFCNRTLVTDFWLDKRGGNVLHILSEKLKPGKTHHKRGGNVRHINFTGRLKRGETRRELCYCIDKHMNQKDWLEGARILCKRRWKSVTYEVIGRPDPTFDPRARDPNFDPPLEKLRILFSNTPTTDPVGLQCNASCMKHSNVIDCTLKCPLKNESRTLDAVCADVVNYYDQKKWLGGALTKCENIGGILVVDFIGSTEKNCTQRKSIETK